MRIIAGTAGSIPIKVPKSLTRPTADRVREAVFSSLAPRLNGAAVLDLYAGSGSLGLEALSRGATSAVFVESGAAACDIISENLAKTSLSGGTVIKSSVSGFLAHRAPGAFDLVFADPPYAVDEESHAELVSLMENAQLASAIATAGLLILESLVQSPLPQSSLWTVEKEKKYGKTRVSFLTPVT
jgi:16S rRNA (guanine966-N2)-methyltransferase